MESQNIEFRAVIKFLTKEGAKAKEIHWRMADVGQPFPLPVMPRPDIPVGGRLAPFVEQWEELTDNKWVHSII